MPAATTTEGAKMDDWTIPDFLKIDEETRKAARDRVIARGEDRLDAVEQRQRELREAAEVRRKAKAAEALARMKEEHAGERWHPKLGWIRDEKSLATLEAQQLAEFERHSKG